MTIGPDDAEEQEPTTSPEEPEPAIVRDKRWWERMRFWIVGRTPH